MDIIVYTDGSSLHNGKPNCVGGWSAVFYIGERLYVRYGHLKAQSSNNRGEVSGILYTINLLREKKDWNIKIISDSQYAVKSINEWRHKWKKLNYDGIKNPDLLIPMFDLYDQHGNIIVEWTKGHIGTKGNEMADKYAGMGMRNSLEEKTNDKVDIKMISEEFIYEAQRNSGYSR